MDFKDLKKEEFPFDGEFFLARKKKFEELIFFVHFYEGSKKQIIRHIKMVNTLGFDAFAFQLQGSHKDFLSLKLPISANQRFGAKHLYADQIETLLNLLPGKKIVFAFSNPSASAIEAMARRRCSDTVGLICDSGPTARFLPSAYQLFKHEYEVKPALLNFALAPFLSMAWSPFLHKDVQSDLALFPQGFKILSIRGWKDRLIPASHIDEIFEPHLHLDWAKLSLPEADHLHGLRDFKDEYIPSVERFLGGIATAVEKP